jgi:hypothetical protein
MEFDGGGIFTLIELQKKAPSRQRARHNTRKIFYQLLKRIPMV